MVNKKKVQNAIMSFRNSSAAKINGLKPLHLKNLIGKFVEEARLHLFLVRVY